MPLSDCNGWTCWLLWPGWSGIGGVVALVALVGALTALAIQVFSIKPPAVGIAFSLTRQGARVSPVTKVSIEVAAMGSETLYEVDLILLRSDGQTDVLVDTVSKFDHDSGAITTEVHVASGQLAETFLIVRWLLPGSVPRVGGIRTALDEDAEHYWWARRRWRWWPSRYSGVWRQNRVLKRPSLGVDLTRPKA